jgi:teichuronic acid biosynthesis glycosyltransferase TuaG
LSRPYFSVLLPVYNGAATVARAIESVRAQEVEDWEILAVDDGSTDTSGELLRDLAREEPRIRVLATSNSGGPARPRNLAMRHASGRVFCLLDQDDYWLPNRLALQRPLLGRPEVGVVYGDAWIEEGWGMRRLYSEVWGAGLTGRVAGQLIASNFIPALTAAVPAAVAGSVGPLDERLVGVDDYHWWLRIVLAGFEVDRVAEPIAVYTVGASNLSHDQGLHLRSLDMCLADVASRHPQWRTELAVRRAALRTHAFDFHANRLASATPLTSTWSSEIVRSARWARSLPEAKRIVAAALPASLRPMKRT